MKRQPRRSICSRKCSVFSEKAVAGMEAISTAGADHVQQGVLIEIALLRRCWPQGIGFVSLLQIGRLPIRCGVDGHSANPEGTQAPNDPRCPPLRRFATTTL